MGRYKTALRWCYLCGLFLTIWFLVWLASSVLSSATGESLTGLSPASWPRRGSTSCRVSSRSSGQRWWVTQLRCARSLAGQVGLRSRCRWWCPRAGCGWVGHRGAVGSRYRSSSRGASTPFCREAIALGIPKASSPLCSISRSKWPIHSCRHRAAAKNAAMLTPASRPASLSASAPALTPGPLLA